MSCSRTEAYGFDAVKAEQQELGDRVRAVLAARGIVSIAADGFGAPGVVVSYTDDPRGSSRVRSLRQRVSRSRGACRLQCDEGDDFSTFRLGLFGLDKLHNVDRTVASLESVLDQVL